MMEGRAGAPPGVFGTASPVGWVGTGIGLQTATTVQDSGEGSVSEPPRPRGPPTFKYSSRIRKGSQLMFLKKLMEQNEKLDAGGLSSWLA